MSDHYSQTPPDLIPAFCEKRLSPPVFAKLFTGIIFSDAVTIEIIKKRLISRFGELETESTIHPFDHTEYYNEEMGNQLKRCFLGFKKLVDSASLADIKLATNQMEMEMGRYDGQKVSRVMNLDPGLLSLSNIILATTKNRAQRIYLGKGIYAEVTLLYSRGKGWHALEWTYPDYRTPLALTFFTSLRKSYYVQMKTMTSKKEGMTHGY